MHARHIALFATFLFLAPFVFADHNININTADKAALETLTGIGPTKAQAIIDYRAQSGSYASIEDIQNVSGIGPATYESIKDHITVSGGNSTPPPPSPTPAPSPSPSPSSGKTSSPSPSPSSVATSGSGLSVDAGGDRTVITGADVQFSARAYRDKKVVDNAKFTWNFGDGSTGKGESLAHRFEYPGQYAVIVTVSHDDDRATDRFTVTAEEAELALRVFADGSVEIENLSKRDADLSGWLLESSGERFTLPEGTVLLAEQTIRISPNTLRFSAGSATALHYPSGALGFATGEEESAAASASQTPTAPFPAPAPQAPQATPYTVSAKTVSKQVTEDAAKEEENIPDTKAATSSQVAAAGTASTSWTWWLAAAGLSVGTGAAIYVARRFGRKEWDIIEE